MSDETENTPNQNKGVFSRRSIVKGAAWSVPVLAVAVAAPAAVASVGNASFSWTGSQTSLLQLHVLDSASLITAQVLTTVPTQATLHNGPSAITNANANVTITVARPGGINITLGQARGFGVYSFNGAVTTPASRTAVYQTLPIVGNVGFPLTTFTTTMAVTVAANGALVIPVVFGLAGTNSGISVSALASFPVTFALNFGGGHSYTAQSTISVPVGAGLL